jgi:acid-sensing ion channel, other
MSNGAFRVSPNEEVLVALDAEESLNPTDYYDTCHSTNTKSLEFFKDYSQLNCLSECKSNFVLEKCGCVKFSMIRGNETKVCTQHDTKCVTDAIDEFATTQRFKSKFPCDCLPPCNYLKYKSDVTSGIFSFKQVFKAFNESLEKEFPRSIMSRLVVYFKDDHYESISYYYDDKCLMWKITYIGGVFAFFLGISIISVVEFLYFVVDRIIALIFRK